MKKAAYSIFLSIFALSLLASCSEEFSGGEDSEGGEAVTISVSYRQPASEAVTVTRAGSEAATASENALWNMQVFIFNADGHLKGYKYVSKSDLVQDGSIGTVSVKTYSGPSYIYAVANVPTSIYTLSAAKSIPTSAEAAWSEEDAQQGKIDFTLDDLKAIAFSREKEQIHITDGCFMMSGTAYQGELCTIARATDGSAYISAPEAESDQLIKLHRIVAKVTFKVSVGTKEGKTIAFTPTSYDICNIPLTGSLIDGAGRSADANDADGDGKADGFEDFAGNSFSSQEENVFSVYLPENLQSAKEGAKIAGVHDREADGESTPKVFTNAPDNGTYVVLHGNYTEKTDGTVTRTATVSYYIHLGDFSSQLTDFDVDRNVHYTYWVTVNGVDKIVTQVTTTGVDDPQPGAEGIVLDYTSGKSFTLDSHYEYCVMKFHKNEIAELKKDGYGYCFRVRSLNPTSGKMCESETILVKDDITTINSQLNDADLSWVHFRRGGTYDSSSAYGGNDPGYTNLHGQDSLSLPQLLKHLYEIADKASEWDNSNPDDPTLTYTCYVNENYYPSLNWGQYVNIEPRVLYVADTVEVSSDKRSIYAKTAYSVSQYAIQTFYNTDSTKVIAYGLETIRDDNAKSLGNGVLQRMTGDDGLAYKANGTGSSPWDGLANMRDADMKDVTAWNSVEYQDFRQACMSRNRDLDGNGEIDFDEVRWYCPTIDQYGGMWIGENALSDVQARLFEGSTTGLEDPSSDGLNRTNAEHYFANTSSMNTFWAEEGMATGNLGSKDAKLDFVRCIRNLQSKTEGIGTTDAKIVADKYYVQNATDRTVDLSRMAEAALRTSYQTAELDVHPERSSDANERTLSNARKKFAYAERSIPSRVTMGALVTASTTLCSSDYNEEGYVWRLPNQRELCILSIIGQSVSGDGCRTHFSGSLRYSWRTDGNLVTMGTGSKEEKVSLRCVRDVE